MTKRVIEEAVQAGPAVLVGRGAQCHAGRRARTRCTCSAMRPPTRWSSYVDRERSACHRDEAQRIVAENNHQREQYVKRHWKRDWRDVANYHLCVNTAWLGLDGAAELIVQLARRAVRLALRVRVLRARGAQPRELRVDRSGEEHVVGDRRDLLGLLPRFLEQVAAHPRVRAARSPRASPSRARGAWRRVRA